MSFFTKKGDQGTTKTFGCDQRISKSSAVAEALGSLDEINSFLGLIKVNDSAKQYEISDADTFSSYIHQVQKDLFIVQAQVAGAEKNISTEKITNVESVINNIEKKLPPITTFFVSGGTELAALLDISRTIVRRAERRVVAVHEENLVKVSAEVLAFMNRLSSLFYAMARFANHLAGIPEDSPDYK